jgi:hypothetical protein
MGHTFLKTMPPFILLNLKRGRRVPSATELPNWEPQQALLYAEKVFDDPNFGGTALSYSSVSEEEGK